MKRISILVVTLLALVVVACSSEQPSSSPSESAPTPEPTATPTSEPTATPEPPASTDPAGSDDASGGDTALLDLLPDELDGMSRTEVEGGLDAVIAPLLAQQGIDASDADFTFASYGEGTDAVYVNGLRIPGMSEVQLEMLAQMMSGSQAGGEVEAEPATIGGKDVVRMGGPDVPGAAYLYFSDGAVFTVISESEELAALLLEQLP